ncbi:DNA-directed RNA polymerase subunit delta, partial [Staphylococcus arlettae]
LGHYEDQEVEDRIVQFYTDLNTDGRFLNVGENVWGLRDWYSVDDIEEKIAPTIQKFDILDDEDEEDKNLKLLGEDETEEEPVATEDTSDELTDPEDEQVEEEIDENEIVIDEEDDDLDDEEDEEQEEYDDEEE